MRVTERDANIKHGEPGFLGQELDPNTREPLPPAFEHDAGAWGYDRQITRIVERGHERAARRPGREARSRTASSGARAGACASRPTSSSSARLPSNGSPRITCAAASSWSCAWAVSADGAPPAEHALPRPPARRGRRRDARRARVLADDRGRRPSPRTNASARPWPRGCSRSTRRRRRRDGLSRWARAPTGVAGSGTRTGSKARTSGCRRSTRAAIACTCARARGSDGSTRSASHPRTGRGPATRRAAVRALRTRACNQPVSRWRVQRNQARAKSITTRIARQHYVPPAHRSARSRCRNYAAQPTRAHQLRCCHTQGVNVAKIVVVRLTRPPRGPSRTRWQHHAAESRRSAPCMPTTTEHLLERARGPAARSDPSEGEIHLALGSVREAHNELARRSRRLSERPQRAACAWSRASNVTGR